MMPFLADLSSEIHPPFDVFFLNPAKKLISFGCHPLAWMLSPGTVRPSPSSDATAAIRNIDTADTWLLAVQLQHFHVLFCRCPVLRYSCRWLWSQPRQHLPRWSGSFGHRRVVLDNRCRRWSQRFVPALSQMRPATPRPPRLFLYSVIVAYVKYLSYSCIPGRYQKFTYCQVRMTLMTFQGHRFKGQGHREHFPSMYFTAEAYWSTVRRGSK